MEERPKSVIAAIGRNILGLAVSGYVVLIAVALAIRWAAETDVTLGWQFWAGGLLGSVLFATSEAFHVRPLESGGFGWRLAATIGVLIVSLVVSGLISDAVGWNRQTYLEDPFSFQRSVLEVGVFGALMAAAASVWWVIDRRTKKAPGE